MSQVKKNIPMMQGGGAAPGQQTQTSTPKTYGKFIMNGQEEQVTDDLINQFSNWLSSQPRDVQSSLVDIRKKLQAGEDVNFDAHAQELSSNVDVNLKNARQERRSMKNRSKFGMLADALTNNPVHKMAVAMDALSGFKYNKPVPVPVKPTDIKFSPYEVDYNPTEDGKSRVYSTNPANAAAFDRINRFFDFQEMDEEGRKGANLNFTGFDSMTLEDMLKHTNRADYEAARDRVMSNTATANDWDLLNRFNIRDKGSVTAVATPLTPEQREKQAQQFIDESGVDVEAANKLGITLGEDNLPDFSKLSRDRLHIFSKYSPFSKGKYFGGAVYNGKYYSPEEVQTDAALQSILAPYKEQIAKGDYRDTSSVNFHWGETPEYQEYDPRKGYLAEFHDYLLPQDGRNQQFANLAPRYQTQEGEQFISIPDFSGGTDVYGHAAKTKYLTYNPQTGVKIDYNNPLQVRSAPDLSQQVTITPWGDRYKNKERYAHVFNSGPYDFYIGEKDQRLYVRKTKEGEDKNKGGDYYLVQDFDVYNKIKQGESVSREDIDRMFKGRTGKILQSENKWWADDNTSGYRHVGGSGKNAPWVNLYGQVDMNAEWTKFLAELDSSRENILGKGRKYQYGGAFRGLDTTQKKTSRDKQELPLNVADVTQTAVLGSDQGLNANDRLELASIITDAAGLGLSFIPGAGNIAGGVAGVGATGMQFAADIGRDGLDWGDVGRGAMNLGLDALTFIPGLGTAGKGIKVAKNIRRFGSTALQALAMYGASEAAITSAKKVISGDNWTMDDLRIVLSGLQGAVGLGRARKAGTSAARSLQEDTKIAASKSKVESGGMSKTVKLKGLDETSIIKLSDKPIENFRKAPFISKKQELPKAKEATLTTKPIEVTLTKDERLKLNDMNNSAKNEFLADKILKEKGFLPDVKQGDKSLAEMFDFGKDINVSVSGRKNKETGNRKSFKLFNRTGKAKATKPEEEISMGKARRKVSPGLFGNNEIFNKYRPQDNTWEIFTPWRTLQVTRTGKDSNEALERHKRYQNQYKEYKKGGKIQKFDNGGPYYIYTSPYLQQPQQPLSPGYGVLLPQHQNITTQRLENMPAIGDWGNTLTDFKGRTFSQADLDILNKQHNARLAMGNSNIGTNVGNFQTAFNSPLLSDIIGHVARTTGYGRTAKGIYNANQNGLYNVDNRRGGITNSWIAGSEAIPGQFELNDVNNKSNIAYNPNANNGQGAFVFKNAYDVQDTPISRISDSPVITGEQTGLVSGIGTIGSPIQLDPNVVKATGDRIRTRSADIGASGIEQSRIGGFANLPNMKIDPDNALALGSLAMALSRNNRQAKVMKKAIQTAMGSLESSPFEVYPRFTDYGVNASYENAAKQQLGVKPATSDPLMAYAIEQDAKNKAEQLRLEGRLKTSELFSNYLNRTDDLRRNYAGMRTDVSNRNRQRMAQLNMALAENEAGRIANQYTSLNNFVMEKRDRLAQDRAKSERYDEMELQAQLQNHAQQQVSDFVKSFQSSYDAEIAANPALKNNPNYASLDTYVRFKDPTGYAQKMQEINLDLIRQKRTGSQRYNNLWQLFNPFRSEKSITPVTTMAKGGKTSKSKGLNAAEHIWINQNKDVADAVKQLNKNVLTLFLKATT